MFAARQGVKRMIHIVPASPLLMGQYAEANAQPMVSYRNLLTEGTVASAGLPVAAPRADAITESTAEYWQPESVPDTLRATMASTEIADVCFIGAHTLGTAGAALAVQYYDGAAWQTITTVTPTDDQPFMVLFPRRTATGWGIQVTGAVAQIGLAWIGPRFIIPGGVQPDYQPIWATRRVEKFPGVSRRGHFTGQRIERVGASVSASFMPLDHDFALYTMADFRQHFNEGRAFIWAPAPGVFSRDVAYVWAADGETLGHSILAGGDLVTFSMRMEAYAVA